MSITSIRTVPATDCQLQPFVNQTGLGGRGNRFDELSAYVNVKEMTAQPTAVDAPTETFESVFGQRWTRMVKLATLTNGSAAVAEEIVQDAFEQLHKNWATVHQPTAWLRAAVVNRCRDWLRRRTLERRHAVAADDLTEPDEGIAMRDALSMVTPRQRAAIVLRFYEELNEREIADLLGCRPGTVKSLLARGLQTLRKELQP